MSDPADLPASIVVNADEVASTWSEWLAAYNRNGAINLFRLGLVLYPAFGILDYLVAAPKWLWLLWSTRIAFTAYTLVMMALVNRPVFTRHIHVLTATYSFVAAAGIGLMVRVMGGLQSPYYAGLILVIIGAGLLFLWPRRIVIATHAAIVLTFLLPNVFDLDRDGLLLGASNFFFLVASAVVVSVGQVFSFRNQHEQLVTRMTLEQTKATLEHAHAELKQLDEFKSKFFANITHELKTPLAMILSPLELLIQGDLGPVNEIQKSTFGSMLRSGMKLLKLINDLLDLSKLEESRLQLRIGLHDMVEYVRGLVDQVQPLAQRKGITLQFHTDATAVPTWCDLERMERVFVNLLSNATKFTAPGGNIAVVLRNDADSVSIEVRDDGPGFPADMAERVFERFFQVDMGGTRKFGGTGIGLALARELVELHGGHIIAASEPGQGASFTVTLPTDREHFRPEVVAKTEPQARQGQGADVEIMGLAVEVSTSRDYRFQDIAELTERRVVERDVDEDERAFTVLIVEDTPDIIRVIHLTLRRHFKVMAAPDGLKGLEMALREQPNLIITDLMMPGIDGLELTRRLRADARTKHIPIVMLTARAGTEDRVAGLETGVNAYLGKPFSARELLATVRGLLNIQEEQAEQMLNQRMDSLETIAGGLAHEINNPLNYVKNAVHRLALDVGIAIAMMTDAKGTPLVEGQVAQLEKLSLRMGKMVDTAESGLRRIGGTVDLMGRYSREGYSRLTRPHDLFEAARDVVAVVLPATGREVKVETRFQGDGVIECIPEELHQVLSNLIQNAIEAVPEDGTGRVEIDGKGDDEALVLTVRDNGPGIPEEVRARIFTPFFTTKGPGRGTGMGLTIVRRVVQSLGGTITARSQPGGGTEFLLRLPKQPVAAA